MGFFLKSTAAILILLLNPLLNSSTSHLLSDNHGFISAIISENGLVFAKDFFIEQTIRSLTPLQLTNIEKSVRIPFLGGVHISATNIVLHHIAVSSSTINPENSGIVIVASGANASLSMDWSYSYRTWVFLPIKIFDEGSASVQVEGLEVHLTIGLENKNGTLALNHTQFGCYMEEIKITLNGGASWLYQGFVNAFEDNIRAAVENAISKKIMERTRKLDSLLQSLPKQIDIGDIAALNVAFIDGPVVENSSIEFNVNGLFTRPTKGLLSSYMDKPFHYFSLVYCGNALKMIGISLDKAVFDSALVVLFEEGLFHWIVDKVPDQSLLNTSSWKLIIPQLYRKYPNDEMLLNILIPSPPLINITPKGFYATILLDMTVEVLEGEKTVPVACITVDFTVSGAASISGNKLISKAHLDGFSLSLKWSKIGNFPMFLIQGVMRIFLNTVVMSYVNIHLHEGISIPVFQSLTLQNAEIVSTSSKIIICSDLAIINSDY